MGRGSERRRRIAFYAPLKAPDHATPSGDRAMARLIMQALGLASYEVTVASDLRSFSREPDEAVLADLQRKAATIRSGLLDSFSHAHKPDLWVTYHPFYKSPDLIGPPIAERLGIPYVSIEASHAPKRNHSGWKPWQALAENALRLGAAHFCLTRRDRHGLADFLGDEAKLVDLPPFLETGSFKGVTATRRVDGPVELITVAMMRPGDKLQSYRFLGEALAAGVPLPEWRLTIIGDGPARADVEAAFVGVDRARLNWRGALEVAEVRSALSQADLYVWPGFGEAYGMAYLEAQASGLPVIALDCGGISEVVWRGETGILVAPGGPAAFATALGAMMFSRSMLADMGASARRLVLGERTLERAAAILRTGIEKVLG